jgi:hypothetical protein
MKKVIISIDPGKQGAIAIFIDGELHSVIDIPLIKTEVDRRRLAVLLQPQSFSKCFDIDTSWDEIRSKIHVFVEDVSNFPGASARSMRSFGYICGLLDGLLDAYGYSYTYIKPKEWQKFCWKGVSEIKKQKAVRNKDPEIMSTKMATDTKAMSYLAFCNLFPEQINKIPKSKDGRIDAVLIGYYGISQIIRNYV